MKKLALLSSLCAVFALATTTVWMPGFAEETKGVTVTLTQTGGTKKLDHSVVVEATTLSEADQALLEKLLKQSGVLDVKSIKQMGWVTSSTNQWTLIVGDGQEKHEIALDDHSMTPEYSKLIKFILKRDRKPVNVAAE